MHVVDRENGVRGDKEEFVRAFRYYRLESKMASGRTNAWVPSVIAILVMCAIVVWAVWNFQVSRVIKNGKSPRQGQIAEIAQSEGPSPVPPLQNTPIAEVSSPTPSLPTTPEPERPPSPQPIFKWHVDLRNTSFLDKIDNINYSDLLRNQCIVQTSFDTPSNHYAVQIGLFGYGLNNIESVDYRSLQSLRMYLQGVRIGSGMVGFRYEEFIRLKEDLDMDQFRTMNSNYLNMLFCFTDSVAFRNVYSQLGRRASIPSDEILTFYFVIQNISFRASNIERIEGGNYDFKWWQGHGIRYWKLGQDLFFGEDVKPGEKLPLIEALSMTVYVFKDQYPYNDFLGKSWPGND